MMVQSKRTRVRTSFAKVANAFEIVARSIISGFAGVENRNI